MRQCLSMLDQQETSPEITKQQTAARAALDRLQRSLPAEQAETQQNSTIGTSVIAPQNESSASASSTANGNGNSHLERSSCPTNTQQKQDVMRLLLARKMAGPTPDGEAFFLLQWKWWRRWCKQVDFFYMGETTNHAEKVRGLLPEGAVLPQWKEEEEDDDDTSDDEGDHDDEVGPIDNTNLLLDPLSAFHQHWYLDDQAETLRPNLVRGYHYELLPREVYNALRSWYGESTDSICRRTQNGVICLYQTPPTKMTASSTQCCTACRAPRATSRCKRCLSVQYCDRKCQEAHWPYHKVLCKQANGTKFVPIDLNGKVGLNNLGNTCFMNSALQSLSHATPLARHFLSNQFQADVNTENPLGTGGKLALTYDALMKDLWMRNTGTSLSPTALKRAVAMFAPRFAGCLQHDAQEFLAYLLDGLHEDLNRIRKAPYVEMPDVTDGHNMHIAGAEAWDAHKRRNDSLVMDTFYGQFQSTCVCPQCQRVSMSFDAFNHVSLEIPQLQKDTTMSITVIVFRKPSNVIGNPYRYGITLNRLCLVADLKDGLAGLTGIPVNHLVLADIFENVVYELLDDKKSVSTIRPNDLIVAFEVDPYTDKGIHVVATQSILVQDKAGKFQRRNFGFPLMTCFDADLTCRQVWDHMWTHVDRFVRQKGSQPDYVDSQNLYKRNDILKIHVVNNQGQPVSLFSSELGTTTSAIPFDSDELIQDVLGSDCTERFLFLTLQWENPQPVMDEDQEKDDCMPPDFIQPKLFSAFEDHSSLVEVMQRQSAKKNGGNAVTLDQCFETFTRPERLDENNMWYCSKCKEHVRAMKTMKLWRLPNILVVHLKRFEFKHSLRRDKLDTLVDFPLEGLDMSTHCSGLNPNGGDTQESIVDATVDAKYDLFAVVNHFGRMGFGHYTAFCRQWDEEGLSSQWNLFDDSNVRPIDRSDVSGPAAYVLFYRRRQFH